MLAPPALAAAVLGAGAAAAASASSARWTSIGPPLGVFAALAGSWSAPDTVYAASIHADIWRSTDGGVTWSFVSRVAGESGKALLVDPNQEMTLYMTGNAGIYKSSDGGATWQLFVAGEYFVLISRAAPRTLLVCCRDGQIERSDDAGATWSAVGSLPGPAAFSEFGMHLAVDPTNPDTLYAAGSTGVEKSTDGGSHWTSVLTFAHPPDQPLALLVSPANRSTLYLANTPFATVAPDPRVWRSDDAGATWVAMDTGLPGELLSLATGLSGTVYAAARDSAGVAPTRIFQAIGNGSGWRQVGSVNDSGQLSLAVDYAAPERLYALGVGFLRSVDGGLHFAFPARAPRAVSVTQILVGPGGPGSLYVAQAQGYRTFGHPHLPAMSPTAVEPGDLGRAIGAIETRSRG